jgi:hypothetical protein
MTASATDRLEQARQDLAAAEDRLRTLKAEERKHAATPTAYAAWTNSRDDAQSDIGRHRLVVEQREQEVQAETIEAWHKDSAKQDLVNEALAKRMRTEGPALLRTILHWVEEIAAAEAATARINARVPPGEERLKGPDALARTVEMQPEKITREVDVELWVDARSGQAVADQRAVIPISKSEGQLGPWKTPCARRAFKEVAYLPDVTVQRAAPFLQALRLPFFDGAGLAWNGDAHPASRQQMLDNGSVNAPKQPERQKQTRFVAVGPWEPPAELLSRAGATGKRTGLERES